MFPLEIFSEIFSYLASDAHVLVACSHAHPIFTQLVEPTLYAHVMVYNEDPGPDNEHHLEFKPNQLSALLSDNPRTLNYLRSLCVNLLYTDDEGLVEISNILPGLKLERIQLTFGMCIDWESFPLAFRTAFVTCISTSNMKEVCLGSVCHMPLCSFAYCAGLKRLILCKYATPSSMELHNFPQLEALELSDWMMVGYSRGFFSWALTHAPELRSLTIRTPKKRVIRRFLPHLLAICSTSLVNLSIYFTNSMPLREAAPIEIDFPDLPCLERLRLCTFMSSFKCPQNSDNNLVQYALVTIAQILRALSSSLKHLTLILCLRFRGKDISKVDWSPLANFLSGQHCSFQHVDLHIRTVKAGRQASSDEVISMLSRYENLMGLVESGYISIIREMDLRDDINNVFFERCLTICPYST